MILVMEIEIVLTTGAIILPDISWMIIMLLISPAISLIAITLIVRASAKAQTVEEAQQRTVFLVLPVILLVVGQFTGLLLVSIWILLALGVVLALLAAILMKGSKEKFSYESILK